LNGNMTLSSRVLGTGSTALEVSEIGLGCMGMSEFYGAGDEATSIAVIHRAIDAGCTFLDTADMYGPFTNERLVGAAIADRRDQVVLATKFGNERAEDGGFKGINGRPEYVQQLSTRHFNASASTTSTSTTNTASIPRFRSRRPGARSRRSQRPARLDSSALARQRRQRSGARTRCTRSRPSRPNTACGRVTQRMRS
jgi:aryl-alcohol dehydrogenase-like predicted oxidoreductase